MATARQPLEPVVIGADIGNATTSIARASGAAVFFPSVIADIGVRPYDGMSRIATDRHHVTYKGQHAVIGADAYELHGDTILSETGEPHARYVSEAALLCLLAGVGAAYPTADTVAVRLATGAPLSLFEAHGAAIAAHFQGAHEFTYNGHARRVIVERVTVYGEGREAWRLLTDEQRRGNVAIHDVGGKTWNVLLFRDGALKSSRTFDLGVERLFDDVPAIARDAASRWALQAELRRDPKAHAAIRAALDGVVARALRRIELKVALPQAHRHALMGGGALYLQGVIKARYNAPTIVLNGKSPEGANALAYALAASEAA